MEIKEWIGFGKDLITSLGVLVGGGWALWRFVLRRERHPKIQFDLEVRLISRAHDHLIVEVIAIVQNKGLVRHLLRDFRFDLLYLPDGAPVCEGTEVINHQALFRPVFKRRYWISPDWVFSFIDAGVTQNYTYLARVPQDASVLVVFAKFKYPDSESDFHTAQRAFNVATMTPA